MIASKRSGICFAWAALLLFVSLFTSAQEQSAGETEYSVSAFLDVYYVYDFGKPAGGYRQPFLYNHNRHNEPSLNLGYVKASAVNASYRGNIALMAGTYATDNYAQEPEIFRRIFEANAGICLNKKNSIWLDAGIFSSHIGFESAISKDNYTLTRSLLAENSPYYLAGGKISYEPDKNWNATILICNGWQRIRPVKGNTLPSLGTQLKYRAKKISYNWSTFAGTDDPDTLRRFRFFNNFYLQSNFSRGFNFIAGFDVGVQQKKKSSTHYNKWFSPVIILQYEFSERWATAMRIENYTDKNGVIINHVTGFSANSISLNIDFRASKNILCRIEGRTFASEQKVFRAEKTLARSSSMIAASVAVAL